jgi:hypothetical protein
MDNKIRDTQLITLIEKMKKKMATLDENKPES